jgi:hypothetical protein
VRGRGLGGLVLFGKSLSIWLVFFCFFWGGMDADELCAFFIIKKIVGKRLTDQ